MAKKTGLQINTSRKFPDSESLPHDRVLKSLLKGLNITAEELRGLDISPAYIRELFPDDQEGEPSQSISDDWDMNPLRNTGNTEDSSITLSVTPKNLVKFINGAAHARLTPQDFFCKTCFKSRDTYC